MEEKFKDIEGYEGLYQVSNLGRVKSLERYIKISSGGIKKIKETILKFSTRNGYSIVMIYKNKKGYRKSVNRLVAETFIPNFKNKPQVNHIDGNKLNNVVENLEWCTQKENIEHSYRLGSSKVGQDRLKSKLSNSDVFLIKYNSDELNQTKLALQLGVSQTLIHNIRKNKTWKHI